ncbi:MAG: SIMPL domain-containing protein [Planctomycetota bacterium]
MLRFAAALPAVLVLALVAGADEPKTITVRGHGTVKAKPDTLVMTFHAKGSAEKAADAIEKLNKNLKTMKDDLAAVLADRKVQGAKIEDSGVCFAGAQGASGQVQVIWNGGGNQVEAGANPETNASSEIRVTIPAVDAMKPEDVATLVSALLDKGQATASDEANDGCFNVFGVTYGGGSPVSFTISDPESQLSKAWDEAVKKARTRAETIASRLGLAVGGAVKVRDLSDDGAQDKSAAATAMNWVALRAGRAGTPVSSGETELSVALEVEFELKRAEGEKK